MASAETAVTAGEQLRRFWRWWTSELRACIPAGWARWMQRARVLPLVVAEADGFSIHRFDGQRWKRIGGVSNTQKDAAVSALAAELRNAGIGRFTLGLNPGSYLSKIIHLPQAAEDNLRSALRYELDRHTPFKPEDVEFDCVVVGRDERAREIAVRIVIALKTAIAQAMESVAAAGAQVAAVQPAFIDSQSVAINLLPHAETASGTMQRVARWTPWAVVAGLAAVALVLPVYQKRAQVIELQPQVNIAAQQAQAADVLHQQLDRAQGEYNFLLQKRYASPTSLQLLNEVTRILPDDTWLQNFELRTTSKGKELQLQGETGVAGKMIELFEQSALLTGATFKSPVTQAPGSQGSRFHIGMEVKESAPPAASRLAAAQAQPTTDAAPATVTPTAASAPTASTSTASTSTAASPTTPSTAPTSASTAARASASTGATPTSASTAAPTSASTTAASTTASTKK